MHRSHFGSRYSYGSCKLQACLFSLLACWGHVFSACFRVAFAFGHFQIDENFLLVPEPDFPAQFSGPSERRFRSAGLGAIRPRRSSGETLLPPASYRDEDFSRPKLRGTQLSGFVVYPPWCCVQGSTLPRN
jgi:hypothetical protein